MKKLYKKLKNTLKFRNFRYIYSFSKTNRKERVEQMHKFITVQRKRIDKEKWYKGCDIQQDPGQEFILEWIDNNAAEYRLAWNVSKCKSCTQWHQCGYRVRTICDSYEHEKSDNN